MKAPEKPIRLKAQLLSYQAFFACSATHYVKSPTEVHEAVCSVFSGLLFKHCLDTKELVEKNLACLD